MELINEKVESYAAAYSSKLDGDVATVYNNTLQTHSQAHMQSSALQGKFLAMMSHMLKPQYILEIGTLTGFSAICLSEGMKAHGELHTIELREADAAIAQNNFNQLALDDRIKLHIGDALNIIPTLKKDWDLIFIDADKVNYINYYELTLPLLKNGGFIIADNVLFHGQVLQEPVTGKSAKAIQAFNAHVAQDERVEQVICTVRDGLSIIRKK